MRNSTHTTRASLQSLRYFMQHFRLLLLPFLGKLFYYLLVIWFALPLLTAIGRHHPTPLLHWFESNHFNPSSPHFYLGLLAVFYLANVISTYCFATLNQSILNAFRQGKLHLAFKQTAKRLHHLMLWCIIRSIVGTPFRLLVLIFRILGLKNRWVLDNHWHLATSFSLILITERKANPFSAIRASGDILRGHYGDRVAMRPPVLFGFIFLTLLILALLPILLSNHAHLHLYSLISFSTVFLILILEEVFGHILRIAVYYYLTEATTAPPFTPDALKNVFRARYQED